MKTLIIRFGRLGDLLLTLPAIRDLAASEPHAEAERHFLVLAEYESLLTPLPELRTVHVFPRGGDRARLEALARQLAERGYHRVLDFQGGLRSRYLKRRLAGELPGGWWSSARHDLRRRLMVARPLWPAALRPGRPLRPVWHRHRDTVARALGDAYRRGEAVSHPLAREAGRRAGGPLALAPGAAWPAKVWPHFPELARRLADRLPLLVLGGPGEEERCEALAGPGVTIRCGSSSLPELAAELSRCRGLVGGDSGLGHLAEALGLPVLTLFGPTVPGFGFAPRNPGSRILERAMGCRPCSLHGRKPCRFGHGDCLARIGPELVIEQLAAMELLTDVADEEGAGAC